MAGRLEGVAATAGEPAERIATMEALMVEQLRQAGALATAQAALACAEARAARAAAERDEAVAELERARNDSGRLAARVEQLEAARAAAVAVADAQARQSGARLAAVHDAAVASHTVRADTEARLSLVERELAEWQAVAHRQEARLRAVRRIPGVRLVWRLLRWRRARG